MHQRSNPNPAPGDALRDQAADLLSSQYGETKTEQRVDGKKVDVYLEHKNLGRTTKIYLEAKDYEKPLTRAQVVNIKVDYEGILRRNAPAILLIVTRSGLTADAQSYVEQESADLRHQTIWQIETGLIDLETYLRFLEVDYKESGLSSYYVENGFSIRDARVKEHENFVAKTRDLFPDNRSCFKAISDWCTEDYENTPVAVLGGYGTGKTSLATRLAAHLASISLRDNFARQPVVLRLGGISQYASVQGLLGAHFTETSPIPNFNYHNFISLNKAGRYVIILDGFDEMKHAMSWSDFREQVRSLLQLHKGNSKVVLLGRPSAFLSETEERYILKGERLTGENWVTLPDWPRFHELEISNFTDEERRVFISKYLATTAVDLDANETRARSELANEIAGEDPMLFRKPVHSKILTDLARDPNFDLSKFRSVSSRWTLYREFITSLYEREEEKRTRREITTVKRMDFLSDLALWLWTDNNAGVSFSVEHIPKRLYSDFGVEEEDLLPLCRELLVGSILEKKSGNIFFFGHRSFAEFIVASRLLASIPGPTEHETYSKVFRDGVREFLIDSSQLDVIGQWAKTFGVAKGRISQAYIDFLSEPHGGLKELAKLLPANSPWYSVLQPFSESLIPNRLNYVSVFEAIKNDKGYAFAWHYCWLTQLDGDGWRSAGGVHGIGASIFDRQVAQSLIEALFSRLERSGNKLFVSEDYAGLRRICQDALKTYEDGETVEFVWSHKELGDACVKELNRNGIAWETEIDLSDRQITISTNDFFSKLTKKAQDNFIFFINEVRSWISITERVESVSKRKEVVRNIKRKKRGNFKPPRNSRR